jgi:putative tryptophan/tyrosine transport system substrate-binding protein
VTGNASGGEQSLVGKRIGLLKELVPSLAWIGVIFNAEASTGSLTLIGAKSAANRLGLEVLSLPIRTLVDIAGAFASGVSAGAGAFYIVGDGLTMSNRVKVAEFAARAGKPTIGQLVEQARAGLLMAYAPDTADGWGRTASYAVKILAGAKPGDLPIEQARKFTFVINLKSAQALGITVPPRLMQLADELVE